MRKKLASYIASIKSWPSPRTPVRKWLLRLLRGLIAVGMALFVFRLPLDSLEFWTYDLRVRLKPTSEPSGQVQTVAVTSSTLRQLQREPTVIDHTSAIEYLLSLGALKIVYIMDPSTIEGSILEKLRFAKLLQDPRLLVAVNELPPAGQLDMLKLPHPYQNVAVLPGPTTSDRTILAKDGVTRRLIVSSEGIITYPFELIRDLYHMNIDDFDGQYDLLDSQQALINYRPTGTYSSLEFLNVRDGFIEKSKVENKIILVGRDTADTVKEYVTTPFSREVIAMSMLEMHANMLDTVIQNQAPKPTPPGLHFIITLLISVMTVYIVLNLRPIPGLGILALTLISYGAFTVLAFWLARLWLPIAQPLVVALVGYYFIIPYRLIMENRKSWEYFQKNRLLTQVEELKSNFLRMMSHDLKTPLARIQGMTSIVLAEEQNLSFNQKRAVQSILTSTEELSDFISSILSLGRIESQNIKLDLRSRDINSVLQSVIAKLDFHSKRKNISIITEFEPLFSFKFDEELIQQVFSNLIENAIKYSPEGSRILVTTEELEGQVIIQVADQGIGIPIHDLTHIFDKFYRSPNAQGSDASGSGLGLYLVKYFVELHNGTVEVESVPDKGSTFTVTLPMSVDKSRPLPPTQGAHYV